MKYVVYKDTSGYYRWRFVATNGRIIADSGEGYVAKDDCLNGIRIMKGSASAEVVDTTVTRSASSSW